MTYFSQLVQRKLNSPWRPPKMEKQGFQIYPFCKSVILNPSKWKIKIYKKDFKCIHFYRKDLKCVHFEKVLSSNHSNGKSNCTKRTSNVSTLRKHNPEPIQVGKISKAQFFPQLKTCCNDMSHLLWNSSSRFFLLQANLTCVAGWVYPQPRLRLIRTTEWGTL